MAVGSLASVSGMVPAGLSSTLNGGAGAVGLLGQSIAFNRQLSQQRQAQTGTDTTGTAATSTASAASLRQTNSAATSRTAAPAAGGTAQSTQTASTQSATSASSTLTAAEAAEVAQLKALQQAAQQQAQAQLRAAGAYGGAVTYQYARGPDGVIYIVGASVSFNTGSVPGDPAATIAKMETVRRAALASPRLSAAALQALQSADAAIADAEAALRSGQTAGSALSAYKTAAGLGSPANRNTSRLSLVA